MSERELPTQLIARCSYSCATRVSELRHNKRRIPPKMTNFACLYTATGPSRALRTERSPRTTAARGVSHFTHGVTGPRQIYGYSLSGLFTSYNWHELSSYLLTTPNHFHSPMSSARAIFYDMVYSHAYPHTN